MIQITAQEHAYNGELVHGQDASVRIVCDENSNALLHNTIRDGCLAVAHYIDVRFGEDEFKRKLNKHPFKKQKGKSTPQEINWFQHTKNKAWRQQHGFGKYYTHEELIDSMLNKCGKTIKGTGGLQHYTKAMINRWNRYMRYMNLLEHRAYEGAFCTYKVQVKTQQTHKVLPSKKGHLCGVEIAQL